MKKTYLVMWGMTLSILTSLIILEGTWMVEAFYHWPGGSRIAPTERHMGNQPSAPPTIPLDPAYSAPAVKPADRFDRYGVYGIPPVDQSIYTAAHRTAIGCCNGPACPWETFPCPPVVHIWDARGFIEHIADFEAHLEGIPRHLYVSVIEVESNFDIMAQGPHGEYGLAQLKEATALSVGVPDYRENWRSNLIGGARYLERMRSVSSSWEEAVQKYNGGSGRVAYQQKVWKVWKHNREVE